MEQFTPVDFTLKIYRSLLESLIAQGHTFQPYAEFLERPAARAIILRHDVEARYGNALAFAKIQHELGVRGTYYFRFLPRHFDKEIIRQIAALGHETGYHYDDLSHCHGDYDKAIRRFEANLATLREIAPVKTICMEGAPLSKWDNRELWSKPQAASRKPQALSPTPYALRSAPYALRPKPFALRPTPYALRSSPYAHYRDYGIIGEPYFDTDFSRVFYLTDTGRRWDGEKVSVRDKANSKFQTPNSKQTQNSKLKIQNFKLHSTADIIAAANAGLLPDQIMFTFHPQRWTDKRLPWVKELVMQRVKNVVKRVLISR
jgi:hypothetical protein